MRCGAVDRNFHSYLRVRPFLSGWRGNPSLPRGLGYELAGDEEMTPAQARAARAAERNAAVARAEAEEAASGASWWFGGGTAVDTPAVTAGGGAGGASAAGGGAAAAAGGGTTTAAAAGATAAISTSEAAAAETAAKKANDKKAALAAKVDAKPPPAPKVRVERLEFHGGSGAQSSLLPAFDAFLSVAHTHAESRPFIAAMREYMPPGHAAFVEDLETGPQVRALLAELARRLRDGKEGREDPDKVSVRAVALADKAEELTAAYNAAVGELAKYRKLHM